MVGRGRGAPKHYQTHNRDPIVPTRFRHNTPKYVSNSTVQRGRGRGHNGPQMDMNDVGNNVDHGRGQGLGRGRGRGRGGGIDNRPAWMTQKEKEKENDKSQKHSKNRNESYERDRYKSNRSDQENNNNNRKRDRDGKIKQIEDNDIKNSPKKRTKSKDDERVKRNDTITDFTGAHDDIYHDAMISIDQQKEDEEIENLLKQTERLQKKSNEDDVDLLQLLNNGENDDNHELERARKRRLRAERAALLQNKSNNKTEKVKIEQKTHNEISNKTNPTENKKSGNQDKLKKSRFSPLNDTQINSHVKIQTEEQRETNPPQENDDDFDMFNDEVVTPPPTKSIALKTDATISSSISVSGVYNDDYDDSEGYYKSTIGEIISFKSAQAQDDKSKTKSFKVLGTMGKGVFSSVIKCVSTTNENEIIAIKLIRNNETMTKAAQKESRILHLLNKGHMKKKKESSSSSNSNVHIHNHYIVSMMTLDDSYYAQSTHFDASSDFIIPPTSLLEYRHHAALLFEYLPYNLRQILKRFGSGVGINLQAIQSYARQLFSALCHLRNNHIVHADIKPENILVSADYSLVKLADFGSAFFVSDMDVGADNPTPYLVSRFYRPPEIILGLEYNHPSVDLWSVGVTLAELFTGNVLFPGHCNNDMIRLFMESLGCFSNKMIKRHVRSYKDKLQLQPFFDVETMAFYRQSVDKVTKRPVLKIVNLIEPVQGRKLSTLMLKSCGVGVKEERVNVMKFADLLTKCLALDPTRRISADQCREHIFFEKSGQTDKKKKNDVKEVVVER